MVEALTSGGIARRPVSGHVPKAHIRLRRDTRLSDDERVAIVERAESLCGMGYGYHRAREIAAELIRARAPWFADALKGLPGTRPASGRGTIVDSGLRGYVCSDVYAVSYEYVAERTIAPTEREIVCPAALSESPLFVDIPVTWCAVSESARLAHVATSPGSPAAAAPPR